MKNEPEGAEYRYSTNIEQCDVKDRDALVLYRQKRYEWLSWYELKPGEPNTIQQQIFNMIFIDLAYRTLAKPREGVNEDSTISANNGLLAYLLDHGYVATQILAIRRMLDYRKDVFSVRRLLDDITQNRSLLTREIYVGYDGIPYDPESWQELPQNEEMNIFGIQGPGMGKYMGSMVRHEMFDRLSGVSQPERKRSDLIREEVFAKLNNRLKTTSADKLILLSHKFFAHAATLDSRDSLQYSGLSLADVESVQRAIIRVERTITDLLLFLGVARDIVPLPPLGLFKGLTMPYSSVASTAVMESHWDQLVAERNKWADGLVDDL